MLCRIEKGKARFKSRNDHDWTAKFPELAKAAAKLSLDAAMLDGEVVALNSDGTTSFQTLQNVFQTRRTEELVYYVFDILHLNGYELTAVPLERARDLEVRNRRLRPVDPLQRRDPGFWKRGYGTGLPVALGRDHLQAPGFDL